ncbi:hypothetical protein K439DRAFT_1623826 [Ramaria rubella]|nr:hypothetical protein K439DRAFT_1623826 [Ramaria rubella]
MAFFLPFLSLLLHLFTLKLSSNVHQLRLPPTRKHSQQRISSLSVNYLGPHNEGRQWNCVVSAIVRVTIRDGIYHKDVGYGVANNVPLIKYIPLLYISTMLKIGT